MNLNEIWIQMKSGFKSRYCRVFSLFASVLLFYFIFQWNLWNKSNDFVYDLQNLSNRAGELDFVPLNFSNNQKPPLILVWTDFYGYNLTEMLVSKKHCPYNCQITDNRALSDKADIRVFHIRDFFYWYRPKENEKALNVYLIQEPPTLTYFWAEMFGLSVPPASYFDLSMTYRSNADIYLPYDQFLELDGTESEKQIWTEKQVDEAISRKKKPIFVAISNCDYENGRLVYLKELQKHIDLTFVGRCNKVPCDDGCLEKGLDDHYFYLAFENSVCPEYQSEKFWRVKQLIVPIVLSRGAIPQSYPNNSFVAASDFESPKKLANYLTKMIEDKESYRQFFSWTKKYRRSKIKNSGYMGACHLCKLALATRSRNYSVHKNYKREWANNECIDDYAGRLVKKDPLLKVEEMKMKELVEKTEKKRIIGRVI